MSASIYSILALAETFVLFASIIGLMTLAVRGILRAFRKMRRSQKARCGNRANLQLISAECHSSAQAEDRTASRAVISWV